MMTKGKRRQAAAAGALLSLSFSPASLAPAAPLAVAWLVALCAGETWRRRFALGYVFGLAWWCLHVWWLYLVAWYSGWPIVIGVTAAIATLAVFPAATMAMAGAVRQTAVAPWWLAVVWTAMEFLRTQGAWSFSWGSLGHCVWHTPFLARLASYGGVPCLTFLLTLTGGCLGAAWLCRRDWPHQRQALLMLGAAWGLALLLAGQATPPPRSYPPFNAALVQGNHDQDVKWAVGWEHLWQDYAELSRRAAQTKPRPDLIIWPEVAITRGFYPSGTLARRAVALARDIDVPVLAGFNKVEVTSTGEENVFNCAILLPSDDEELLSMPVYAKQHLVPFGEYVPFQRYLPFVGRIVESAGGGGFSAGTAAVHWRVGDATLAAAICFESTIPQLVRRLLSDRATILVVMTNDAWFEPSAGPEQHMIQAVFRAIENGVPVLHCANTGETCWIDAGGNVQSRLPRRQAGVLTCAVAPGSTRGPIYRRYGDVFGWSVTGLWALGMMAWLPSMLRAATASTKEKQQ